MANLLAQLQSRLTDASVPPLSEAQLNHLRALLGPNVPVDPAPIIPPALIPVIPGNVFSFFDIPNCFYFV